MLEQVKNYYGKTLRQSGDLQTDACCTTAARPSYIQPFLTQIHDEVMKRHYGCGLIAPEVLDGLTVLGCGNEPPFDRHTQQESSCC